MANLLFRPGNLTRSALKTPESVSLTRVDYADLVNTDKATTGLLSVNGLGLDIAFDVRDDDGRSYRRAVLDFSKYYAANGRNSEVCNPATTDEAGDPRTEH